MSTTAETAPDTAALDALERAATALLEADAAADHYAKKTRQADWSATEYHRLCNRVRALQREFCVACSPELVVTLLAAARPSIPHEVIP